MKTLAVVMERPECIALSRVALSAPGDADVVVDVAYSGISAGTERLLWSGRMPPFPGMGYPLVPGYEAVGIVSQAGADAGVRPGDTVFVPGANCFSPLRSLFGAAAARLVVPGARVVPLGGHMGERGILLALAATARHAIAEAPPDLIVGHGVLGRLLARLSVLAGARPRVWERSPARMEGHHGYPVLAPEDDPRRDYRVIVDVSGDPTILDSLIGRLASGGEIVLAGFYAEPLSFAFPPAFMREARLRVAAQWQPTDLRAVHDLAASGRLNLDGLITHRSGVTDVAAAYRTAFSDPSCLKMVLTWSPQ